MTIEELAQRFGISRRTINTWRTRYSTFPAPTGIKRGARYGRIHIEWIEAHLALKHNSVSTAAAVAYCKEAGITLTQYVRRREQAVRDFGIGIS